jgi:hypothetical protein
MSAVTGALQRPCGSVTTPSFPRVLRSESDILAAECAGELTIKATHAVFKAPVVCYETMSSAGPLGARQ